MLYLLHPRHTTQGTRASTRGTRLRLRAGHVHNSVPHQGQSAPLESPPLHHCRHQRSLTTIPSCIEHPYRRARLRNRRRNRSSLPHARLPRLGRRARHPPRPRVLAPTGRLHPGTLARCPQRSAASRHRRLSTLFARTEKLHRAGAGDVGDEGHCGVDGAAV